MGMHDNRRGTPARALCAFAAALALASAASPTRAAEEHDGGRPKNPGFRTNFALYGAFGGASCLGKGDAYAECGNRSTGWKTRLGFALGAQFRPARFFSLAFDVGVVTLGSKEERANRWRDVTVGPLGRFHLPIRIGNTLLEPTVGLGTGLVYGVYKETVRAESTVDLDHRHYGPFLSLVLGADFFPVPRFGFGFEFRYLKGFYTTVCFETASGNLCRGTDEEALVVSEEVDSKFLGDRGISTYPWKLFWGLHALYYF